MNRTDKKLGSTSRTITSSARRKASALSTLAKPSTPEDKDDKEINTAEVNFSRKGLETLSDEDIQMCINCKKLDLSSNRLQSLTFLTNGNQASICPDLRILKASFNYITSLDSLKNNIQLQELTLEKNKITNLVGISSFKRLRLLNLRDNLLRSEAIENSVFSSTVFIKILDLSGNKLNNLTFLKPLTQIQELYLDNTGINSLDTIPTFGMKNLAELSVCDNNISTIKPKLFSSTNFPSLSILSLSNNQLEGQISDMFDGGSILTELHVKGNRLNSTSNIDKCLPSLEYLDIRDNYLDKVDLLCEDLAPLKELILLKVKGNPLCTTQLYSMDIVSRLSQLRKLDDKELSSGFNKDIVLLEKDNIDINLDIAVLADRIHKQYGTADSKLLDEEVLKFPDTISSKINAASIFVEDKKEYEEALRMIEEFETRKMKAERKVEYAIEQFTQSLQTFKDIASGKEVQFEFIDSGRNSKTPDSARSSISTPRPQSATGVQNLEKLNQIRDSISEAIRPKTTANISKRIRDAQRFSREMYVEENTPAAVHTPTRIDETISVFDRPGSSYSRLSTPDISVGEDRQKELRLNLEKVASAKDSIRTYRNPHEYKPTKKLVVKRRQVQ